MASITWTQTPTMYEITLPSGNAYYLKDNEVRQWVGDGTTSGAEKRITTLETEVAKLSNATHWLGVTTTSLTDGSTTNPITINGESVTAVSGDIVQDSNGNEYIFNGTAWQALGSSVGTLKAFAYVDTGEVTITPAGSNASSSVSGTCSVTPSGSVSGTAVTLSTTSVGSVTNAGSMPTFTVANEILTITAGATPTVSSVTVADGVDTVTDPTFTGSSSSGTISGTAAAQTFTGTEATHTVTPAT